MLDHSQVHYSVVSPIEEKLLLPSMTVAFINCLPIENSCIVKPKPVEPETPLKTPAISLVPLGDDSTSAATQRPDMSKGSRPGGRCTAGRLAKAPAPDHHVVVRHLIQSISHHFSNLLMGIWGNITLLKMGYGKNHPVHHHLEQMEKLIESGAFLTHMVLGYIGERRTVTRRLRLDQIVQELFEATGGDPDCLDRYRLKKRLQYAATIQHPPMIAASTGKVLDLLLRRLEKHRLECRSLDLESPEVAKKIHQIDGLITHGHHLVSQLLLIAGEQKPEMVPTPLRPVLVELLRQLIPASADTEAALKPLPAQCTMLMDQALTLSALQEIVGFLLDDAPNALDVTNPNPLESFPLRVVYHRNPARGYVILLVPSHRRCHRFWDAPDSPGPFWDTPRGNNSKSLALAAAGAVIKAHGGFIRQDSNNRAERGFQIHLPLMPGQ